MSFVSDLKFGQMTEEYVSELLKETIGKKLKKVENKSCDLKTEIKIEIKTDRLSRDTGNVAIELSCSDKPSGISATKADVWVWKLEEDCFYWAFTKDIKRYLKKYENKYKVVKGGDGYRVSMAIVSLLDFVTYIAKPA